LKATAPEKNKKSGGAFQKIRTIAEGQSFVSVGFGGRQLVDKYCIWLAITIAICVIVLLQLIS